MVKIKKGISMIALLITIAVFLILLTVITISSDKIVNNTKKKQFAREIYEVQNLVDKYKYEKEEYPYTILDDNTKESISIDITDDLTDQFDKEGVKEGDKVELYTIHFFQLYNLLYNIQFLFFLKRHIHLLNCYLFLSL